jgi:hypothetical protein
MCPHVQWRAAGMGVANAVVAWHPQFPCLPPPTSHPSGPLRVISHAAAVVAALLIRGDMALRGAWDRPFIHPRNGRVVLLRDSWLVLGHFISAQYQMQLASMLFTGLAACVVGGFLGSQLWHVLAGVTTNEAFKRKDLAAAVAQQEQLDSLLPGSSSGAGSNSSSSGRWGSKYRDTGAVGGGGSGRQEGEGSQPLAADNLPPNFYDRGAWCNLSEVLFPRYHLNKAAQSQRKGK